MALWAALATGAVPVQAQNTTAAVGGKVTTVEGRTVPGATVCFHRCEMILYLFLVILCVLL